MVLKLKGARFIKLGFQLYKEKVDIEKLVISNMNYRGKKGFIIKSTLLAISKPLCIKLPKINGYAKYFDETKHLNF